MYLYISDVRKSQSQKNKKLLRIEPQQPVHLPVAVELALPSFSVGLFAHLPLA